MKDIIKKIKDNKLLFIITIITIIFLIMGILYPALITKSNKTLIKSSLDNFFLAIKNNKLNYQASIISTLTSNVIITLLIWLLGISIIGLPVIIMLLIAKSFILGFSISSIISVYKVKGILIAVVYIIPIVINLLISYILCYYAISFSIMLFNYLFIKREYSRKIIVKRYIKILLFSIISIIVSSVVEVFLIPIILKYII